MKTELLAALALLAMSGSAFAEDRPDPSDVKVGKPEDISQEQFAQIRKACATRYSDNYELRVHCECMQFDAIRVLRGARETFPCQRDGKRPAWEAK